MARTIKPGASPRPNRPRSTQISGVFPHVDDNTRRVETSPIRSPGNPKGRKVARGPDRRLSNMPEAISNYRKAKEKAEAAVAATRKRESVQSIRKVEVAQRQRGEGSNSEQDHPDEVLTQLKAQNVKRGSVWVNAAENRRGEEIVAAIASPDSSSPGDHLKHEERETRKIDPEESSAPAWAKMLNYVRKERGWKKSIESLFAKFDKDGSGEIDIGEFREAVITLGFGLTPKQLVYFRRDIDQDGDGYVSLKEFLLAIRLRMKAQIAVGSDDPLAVATESAWTKLIAIIDNDPSDWKHRVQRMFEAVDNSGTGAIDMMDLNTGLVAMDLLLSTEELRGFAEDVDEDGSGKISFDQFVCAIQQRRRMANPLERNDAGGKTRLERKDEEVERDAPAIVDQEEPSPAVLEDNRAKQGASKILEQASSAEENALAVESAWKLILDVVGSDDRGWETAASSCFSRLDLQRAGSIDMKELGEGLVKLGINLSSSQLLALMRDIGMAHVFVCFGILLFSA